MSFEVIVDEAKGLINCYLIEMESVLVEVLLKFTSNNCFQLFLDILLNFTPEKDRLDRIAI